MYRAYLLTSTWSDNSPTMFDMRKPPFSSRCLTEPSVNSGMNCYLILMYSLRFLLNWNTARSSMRSVFIWRSTAYLRGTLSPHCTSCNPCNWAFTMSYNRFSWKLLITQCWIIRDSVSFERVGMRAASMSKSSFFASDSLLFMRVSMFLKALKA